jgi:hypothetical protein
VTRCGRIAVNIARLPENGIVESDNWNPERGWEVRGSAGGVKAVDLAMRKSTSVLQKKRYRPATGRVAVTGVQLAPELRANVDTWAAMQPHKPSQSEAIGHLVELGLAESRPMKRRSPKAASKASDMAAQQIDKLADPSATPEQRQQRKRRLLKGPTEFRDIRGDLPEPKP